MLYIIFCILIILLFAYIYVSRKKEENEHLSILGIKKKNDYENNGYINKYNEICNYLLFKVLEILGYDKENINQKKKDISVKKEEKVIK